MNSEAASAFFSSFLAEIAELCACSFPGCACQRVQRKFEIPSAVRFGVRQATAGDVHLERMQDKLWHRQHVVAGVAQPYEFGLVLAPIAAEDVGTIVEYLEALKGAK